MTLQEFYHNPAGKGVTALNINAVKKEYDARYERIANKMNAVLYQTKKHSYYRIGFPSEVDGIVYDVVVAFDGTTYEELQNSQVSFFSNSPSFVYTYAYAYNKHKIFINMLKEKLPSECFSKPPKEKNPYGIVSYDFSIYAGVKFILDNNLLSEQSVFSHKLSVSKRYIYDIIKSYTDLQKRRGDQKQFNKMLENDLKKVEKASKMEAKSVSGVKQSKVVDKVDKVKSTKSTKKVKRI